MVLNDCCKKIKVGDYYFVIQNGLWQYGCNHCRANHKTEYFEKNQERISTYNKCSVLYKGKKIRLDFNPRRGVCRKCGVKVGNGIKQTNIHHKKYHDDDVLKDTIELCNRCHKREHARLKMIVKAKDIKDIGVKTPTIETREKLV
jgi:hypothetical protein